MKKIILLISLISTMLSCAIEPTQQKIIEAVRNENLKLLEEYFSRKVFKDTFFILGKTPLSYAVEKENVDIVQLLLGNGIDPNRQNIDETTPISLSNNPVISILLHQNGAVVNSFVCNGGTICQVLRLQKKEDKEQIKFLEDCSFSISDVRKILETERNISKYKMQSYPSDWLPRTYNGRRRRPRENPRMTQSEWKINEQAKYNRRKSEIEKIESDFFSQFQNFKEGDKVWIKAPIFDNPEKVDCEQLGKSENLWKLGEKERKISSSQPKQNSWAKKKQDSQSSESNEVPAKTTTQPNKKSSVCECCNNTGKGTQCSICQGTTQVIRYRNYTDPYGYTQTESYQDVCDALMCYNGYMPCICCDRIYR